MKQQDFQPGEIRDENDNILEQGAYGKKTPFTNGNNTGILDYIMNNFRALKNLVTNFATQAEAEAGTDDTKIMTPLRVWDAVKKWFSDNKATQTEAEAGTDNTKPMTPLRVKEAFDKNFSDRKLKEATERIENIYAPVDDGFIGMKIEGGGTIFFDYMLGYKYGSLAVAPITSNLHSYHVDKDRNIVVCDDPNDTTKQHRFYVVSDYDIGDYKHGENLMWADTASASMYNILVGTETGFGKGYSNTEKCIAAASADNRLEWNANAYNMIWHYVWKGDWQYRSPKWFVPSKDELNVLLNMQWHEAARRVSYDGTVKMKQLPINFYSYYWSSSESSATLAHYAIFYHGSLGTNYKNNANSNLVRLCRTF